MAQLRFSHHAQSLAGTRQGRAWPWLEHWWILKAWHLLAVSQSHTWQVFLSWRKTKQHTPYGCPTANFFSQFVLVYFLFFPYGLFFFFFNFILLIFLYSRFLLVIHFLHISVYMSIPISQFIPPPPPPPTCPPWCPYVCSLHLCLYFCTANWFICTIFLGSTYVR